MKVLTLVLLLALTAGLEAAPAETPLPASPLTPRMMLTRERLKAIFRLRDESPAAPDFRLNPFRLPADPGTVAVQPGGRLPSPASDPSSNLDNSDEARLIRIVNSLKLGRVETKDGKRLVTMIDQATGTYAEGAKVRIADQNTTVVLLIKQITSNTVTFALNDAVYTVRK